MSLIPVQFNNGILTMIDQRLLPNQQIWREYTDFRSVAEAIQTMVVRGAPAIGIAAAYGAVLGANAIEAQSFDPFFTELEEVCTLLAATRPTAVNLNWALERIKKCASEQAKQPISAIKKDLLREAQSIASEDLAMCKTMGGLGAQLLASSARVLTHCNAGALATGGYGTALGVIRAAVAAGKDIHVIADETRPLLQGGRLTAWEMQQEGIPVTLICDNMAGHLMAQGQIDAVIVGADRIAANGDVANKIGTYTVAILAREHGLPFYVAAPTSTIDLALKNGDQIPIEERDRREITHSHDTPMAPSGIAVQNPAFDVTPAHLVTAIITERGIVRDPFAQGLESLFH